MYLDQYTTSQSPSLYPYLLTLALSHHSHSQSSLTLSLSLTHSLSLSLSLFTQSAFNLYLSHLPSPTHPLSTTQLAFDPSRVSYEQLLAEYFLRVDPTTGIESVLAHYSSVLSQY